MDRRLPLWLFLLCLLLGSLLAVFLAWSVKSNTSGSARFGWLGKASVGIASFPDLVSATFEDIFSDPDAQVRVPRTGQDLTDFHAIRTKPGVDVQGLMVRADVAALARAPGWRVLVGTFVVDGKLNDAALALSPQLEIVKVWVLTEEGIRGQKPKSVGRKHVHGFALLRDGSVIFTFDAGVSIQRFDRCGKKIWSVGGVFDHAVSIDVDDRFVWAASNDYTDMNASRPSEVIKIAVATGDIVQRFSMAHVSAANPTVGILGVFQKQDVLTNGNPRNTPKRWRHGFHINDVEPLPAAVADRFKDFRAGDLLLSSWGLNLVLVVDPTTLKVKWWRSGVGWRRQHDPDWQPTGEITVYDNRPGRDYSRIVSMDPASESTRVVFDGRANDFYSHIRGKHQITQMGTVLITSPQQGRVVEVDRDGRLVLDIYNTKPGSKEFSYLMSEAIWFPLEAFDFAKDRLCSS